MTRPVCSIESAGAASTILPAHLFTRSMTNRCGPRQDGQLLTSHICFYRHQRRLFKPTTKTLLSRAFHCIWFSGRPRTVVPDSRSVLRRRIHRSTSRLPPHHDANLTAGTRHARLFLHNLLYGAVTRRRANLVRNDGRSHPQKRLSSDHPETPVPPRPSIGNCKAEP